MKYLPLLWASLWRKPIRTVLTLLSIAVAFLLFGVLHGVIAGFDGTLAKLSDTRLRVTNRANLFEAMPVAYQSRIALVPGVERVSYFILFGGYYQEPTNGFSIAAVDVDTWLDTFPPLHVSALHRKSMHETRTGALVGIELMKQFNWHIGDRITLHSVLWANNKDGSSDWPVDIVGTTLAASGDDRTFAKEMYLNYDYLDAARTARTGTVNQFVVSLAEGADPDAIAIAIDRLFANSSSETTTMNERAWFASSMRQVGDVQMFVNWIIGAVLFTLLFLAGNTMSQSVADRLPELGVLKALGFGDTSIWLLVVAEAMLLSLIAAAIGLAIAATVFPGVFEASGFGPIPMPPNVYVAGLAIALLLALLSAAVPAVQARRLTVVEALSGR
jgi:putative ABC transport system permease protein